MRLYSTYRQTFNVIICQTSTSQIPAYTSYHLGICSTCTCCTYIWSTSAIWITSRHIEFVDTKINKPNKKYCWTFLYYGLAIDNKILVSLNDISLDQSSATKNTSKKVAKLLNYLATNPNASIQYYASGMVIYVHSYASYLFIKKPRIRSGGIHFLSDSKPNSNYYKTFVPLVNGIIHVVYKILWNVMASAT